MEKSTSEVALMSNKPYDIGYNLTALVFQLQQLVKLECLAAYLQDGREQKFGKPFLSLRHTKSWTGEAVAKREFERLLNWFSLDYGKITNMLLIKTDSGFILDQAVTDKFRLSGFTTLVVYPAIDVPEDVHALVGVDHDQEPEVYVDVGEFIVRL